ncbi:MAG: Gfo/Idh/MocA family protein [Bacilli bacterium]
MRTGLIGLGNISLKYVKGLKEATFFDLVAVCDTNQDAIGLTIYKKQRFYQSHEEMIQNEKLDYVIIATPPKTHFEIAKYALEHNVNIIIEKPLTLCGKEMESLFALAREKKLVFNTSFHWQNGTEVKYFNRNFDVKKIEEIHISVNDPYSADGDNIEQDKIPLEGAFIDSGVNALSLIKMWLPFEDIKLIKRDFLIAKNVDLPIYYQVKALIDKVPITITVDWRKPINLKVTRLVYEGKPFIIHHSKQMLFFENQEYRFDTSEISQTRTNATKRGVIPAPPRTNNEFQTMDRMERHYFNFFTNFKGKSNIAMTRNIHRALFFLDIKEH